MSPRSFQLHTEVLHVALETGTLLRPKFEDWIARMSDERRNLYRTRILEAEKHLADNALTLEDRFTKAIQALGADDRADATWNLITARIEQYAKTPGHKGLGELAGAGLLLGVVLEILSPTRRRDAV